MSEDGPHKRPAKRKTRATSPKQRTSDFAQGQKLFRRYRLVRLLGRGGMGIVWNAWDLDLERPVALKFLSDQIIHDSAVLADLKREARRSLDLTHPHIVRIYDFVQDADHACISMEFVDGETLSGLRVKRPNAILETPDLEPWLADWCQAMHYAHTRARVVHCDLKPANLMVNSKGALKITDFGIARSLSESISKFTMMRSKSGTLVYMSPQQLSGDPPSAMDDIYSMGATLYELLTSKPPFYRGQIDRQIFDRSPPSIVSRREELGIESPFVVPLHWEETIAACLAKDPSERPRGAAEIFKQLSLVSPLQVDQPTPMNFSAASSDTETVRDIPEVRRDSIDSDVAVPAVEHVKRGRSRPWSPLVRWMLVALLVGGFICGAMLLEFATSSSVPQANSDAPQRPDASPAKTRSPKPEGELATPTTQMIHPLPTSMAPTMSASPAVSVTPSPTSRYNQAASELALPSSAEARAQESLLISRCEITPRAVRLRKLKSNAGSNFEKAVKALSLAEITTAQYFADEAYKSEPNDPAILSFCGAIQIVQGNLATAENFLERANQADRNFREAEYFLSLCEFKQKKYAAARVRLNKLYSAIGFTEAENETAQLIQFRIFLTLLIEREYSRARDVKNEHLVKDSRAFFYSEAAWELEQHVLNERIHGEQAREWMKSAEKLVTTIPTTVFTDAFYDIGWLRVVDGRTEIVDKMPILPAQPAPKSTASVPPVSPAPLPSPSPNGKLHLTDIILTREGNVKTSAKITLKIGIAGHLDMPSGHLVEIKVSFYDLGAENKYRPTSANVTYEWLTMDRNWSAPTTKYLAAIYTRANSNLGASVYGGFVIRVLVDGVLQDWRAQPEKLLRMFPVRN